MTVPGKIVNLTAVPAPNEVAAAEYYPPVYWLSMAKMPDKSEFPGTGNDGNGINPNIRSVSQFLSTFKTDGAMIGLLAADGVLGSRSGSFTVVGVLVAGSKIGTKSVLFSVAP